jgi:hypothetical protein
MPKNENLCPNVDPARFTPRENDQGLIYKCEECGRVNRTTRPHQKAGPTTASHDKTMSFVWDSARPVLTDQPGRITKLTGPNSISSPGRS